MIEKTIKFINYMGPVDDLPSNVIRLQQWLGEQINKIPPMYREEE